MYPTDKICPGCGGRVVYELTCHTYPRTKEDGSITFYSCLPCDSAYFYSCEGRWSDPGDPGYPGCDWHWTSHLNPGNPRAEANEEGRMGFIPPKEYY